ncbi:MAG: permease [Trueperaceae bacterium]
MQATVAGAQRADARAWLLVAAASAAWVALYRTILPLWDWLVYGVAGLDPATRLGGAVHFFFYDVSKILLLLTGIVFVVTVLRSFLSVERTRALLGGRRAGLGTVLGAVLGVATPFCSCSAVPAFIGFVAAGVPLSATMAFLIASPMVDVVAVTLLYGLFGWQIAALYVGAGLIVAVVAGTVLGRLRLERFVEGFVFETQVRGGVDPASGLGWSDRFGMGRDEVGGIVRRIWPFLLVGIGLGAAIHGWLPEDLFARVAGPDNPFAVPLAVVLGVPLYTNVVGVIPLVAALQAKGLAMGTLLAFMMSVVALSLPEMVLLRRVLKPQLIAVFVAIVAAGIVGVGILFNAVL